MPCASRLRGGVSPAWDELFTRLLAKNPDHRPQTSQEVLVLLYKAEFGIMTSGERPALARPAPPLSWLGALVERLRPAPRPEVAQGSELETTFVKGIEVLHDQTTAA